MIGLEIHVQMSEAGSKLFCDCKANYRGMKPNTNVCPVCLGLPGALPVVNKRSIELALLAAVAFKCNIPKYIVFTRKHYFYPDLPKNYQISMYEKAGGIPICRGGYVKYLDVNSWEWRECRIRRINIEEDPGRTVYEEGGIVRSPYVLVDYNRSGVPLLEVITEPDINSPREARTLVEYILLTLEYLGITNPRLEGVFRVDANISIEGGERVEVKNIGSTMDIEKALNYEIMRQAMIINSGSKVERETRHWDAEKGVTRPLRHKEYEEEYLYFPDPDLPPILISEDMVTKAKEIVLGFDISILYENILKLGVPRDIAWSIVTIKPSLDVYIKTVKLGADPLVAAKILGIDYKGELKERNMDLYEYNNWPPPETVYELVRLVVDKIYTYDTVKGLLIPKIAENPKVDVRSILPEKAENIEDIIDSVIREEEKAVKDYLSGKKQALNYLIGMVIRRVGKRAVDPRVIREALENKLSKLKSSM
ncbi:MAG: Asp-tRNA(Asn)/Glu-tRNA(Gln) amidotransferase subunit GatB [Acidilobaceae archaeon]